MYKNVFIVIFSLLFANQVFAKNTGILVSIKPLHSLVSAVVGKTDKVSLLIKGSMSPHSFALKPSDTKLLNNSAVFFYIDDQLESALKKTVGGLPDDVNVIKVSTFKNLNLLPVREDVNWEEDGHDHHGHGHDHGSNDIHFWLDPNNAIKIIKGITEGCIKSKCSLIGGETAEMPGTYKSKDFDLAGFAVGIVDRKDLIDSKKIKKGDLLIGIRSNGIHSNGYSLIRKLFLIRRKNILGTLSS